MPKVTPELVRALGRQRGERNISVLELARQTGVSRWTLDKVLDGRAEFVHSQTLDRLNSWLYARM